MGDAAGRRRTVREMSLEAAAARVCVYFRQGWVCIYHRVESVNSVSYRVDTPLLICTVDRAIATGCGRGGKGSNVRSGECSNSGSKSWPRVEWREERGRRHCREGRGGKQRGRSRVRDRREEGETEAGAGKATMGRFHAADERNEKERKSGGRGEIKPIDGRWRGRRPGRWLVLGELR